MAIPFGACSIGSIVCPSGPFVPMTESACPKENLIISIIGISERGAVREWYSCKEI
jgi:hypothetical protein